MKLSVRKSTASANSSYLSIWRVCSLCVILSAATSAFAQTSQIYNNGPEALLDELNDAGEGKITVVWSLEKKSPDEKWLNDQPHKICAQYAIVTDGKRGTESSECLTEGISSNTDIQIDTGINADDPPTTYEIRLLTYYNDIPQNSRHKRKATITLNE